jgi:hypothetical protein
MATAARPTRNPQWLTCSEVARLVRIDRRMVYKAIADGRLRAGRFAIKSGDLRAAAINARGDLRIAKVWLLEFMERRAVHE